MQATEVSFAQKQEAATRAAAWLIPAVAIFSEACEEPAMRMDLLTVPIWHRLCMFLVGLVLVQAYREHFRLKPGILAKWIPVYLACFVATVAIVQALAQLTVSR